MSVTDAPERPAGWPGEGSPFHPGERALQERIGLRARMEQVGRRVVRDFMPDQHRELFEQLPCLIVGSLDAEGRPWASILAGRPGFIRSPDPRRLTVAARPGFGDPLGAALRQGAPLGLLGIELHTRRRNRMNGNVSALGDGVFQVAVGQSFGNCPKYIQARRPRFVAEPGTAAAPRPLHRLGATLGERAASLVRRADTFFIATAAPAAVDGNPAFGVDVSHRGGRPGFVDVAAAEGRAVLTAPDFAGNRMFNTFGNLALDPRAGLLFVDFDTGDVLTLTGTAEVIWDGAGLARFKGAERLLQFRLADGLLIGNAVPLRWTEPEAAPQLAATGIWAEAAAAPRA